MKLFISMSVLYCLIVCAAIVWTAKADKPIELPPEILACITDIECELAADALCEQGDLEWCVEEA